MPRTVEISLPSRQTDALLTEIKGIEGVISLRVQREVSVQPRGDVISLQITDRFLHELMQVLHKGRMLQDPAVSVTTSQPLTVISRPAALEITNDSNEAVWEEMQATISRDSNMTLNMLIVMFITGVIAAIGITTNALHVVVGAMVIAPGFEPVVRIGLGVITRNIAWKKGVTDTLKGYAATIGGAVVASFLLRASGENVLGGESSYLPAGVLVSYWTTITVTSLAVSALAGVAGALLIATHRSVLTAGVMIALALIPAATITGMALVAGEPATAGKAFLRLLIEMGFVFGTALLIFGWKKRTLHRRRMQT